MVEMVSQMLIPFALIFALGYFLDRKKLAWSIFAVMTIGFLLLTIPTIYNETNGNPNIAKIGIDSSLGAMEGKEIRFGATASAYWSIATNVISTGSVNSMHDSFMPLSGMNQMLAMMTNCFYGGCGVGLLNHFIFIILTVFISGLMVGRTPEFLGKKIEAREMKIAMIIALLHPFLILLGTTLATAFPDLTASTLNNPSFHGFSEVLYEYTSSVANNGSGFEGLGDNTPWWNISTGFVLILSRFLPIIVLAGFTLVFIIVIITLKPFADYAQTPITIAAFISLFVCLIPTTIGGLLSAIGIAGMDRALRANVITKSGKAVETAGDIDVLLLDKTGTITIGNRKAINFYPANGVDEKHFVNCAVLSSMSDETPEGKSIIELAGIKPDALKVDNPTFIKFTAEIRSSGVDFGNN